MRQGKLNGLICPLKYPVTPNQDSGRYLGTISVYYYLLSVDYKMLVGSRGYHSEVFLVIGVFRFNVFVGAT